MKVKNLIPAFCLLCSMTANAKVKLPQLLSDHMVLQQQTEARLWGEATPNSTVTIRASWTNQSVEAKADAQGLWEATLRTPSATFAPQTLTISDGEPVTLHDVLIGEVWLCSGQSNMEMPLNGFGRCPIENSNNVIADAPNHPGIRVATIARKGALTPQAYAEGTWKEPTPENAQWFTATGYFFALALQRTLQVPVGLINSSWGGSRVEGWMPEEILKGYADVDLGIAKREEGNPAARPMIMYNGLLYPCHNYTIKGFIWYQGCSNVGRADTYADRLATMVSHWREIWREGDIPFYYVEIAPFAYSGASGTEAALLREAQFKAQALIPNSGMVSTNDLVEPNELPQIHPKNKKDIGDRLAYQALVKTYGYKGIAAESPSYKEMTVEENKAIVRFDHAEQGFSPWIGIEGFEVAGANKVFYPAKAELGKKNNEIVVSSPKVKHPVAVRYCFRNFQIGNLKNHRNLPVIPFRTDNW